MTKDEDRHPFVVVEKARDTQLFVQFAGSKSRPLVIDVPLLQIVLEKTTLDEGPAKAIRVLYSLGLQAADVVVIREHEDTPPTWWGEPFRKLGFT